MVISPPSLIALDNDINQILDVTQHSGHANVTQHSVDDNVTQYNSHDQVTQNSDRSIKQYNGYDNVTQNTDSKNVTQHSGNGEVTQEVHTKQMGKGIVTPENNEVLTRQSAKSLTSLTHNGLNAMRNDQSVHSETLDDKRNNVTQDNDIQKRVTQQNVHDVTQAKQYIVTQQNITQPVVLQKTVTPDIKKNDNIAAFTNKTKEKQRSKQKDTKIVTQQPTRNALTSVTQPSVTPHNKELNSESALKEHSKKTLKNNEEIALKSNGSATKQFNKKVTQTALQPETIITQQLACQKDKNKVTQAEVRRNAVVTLQSNNTVTQEALRHKNVTQQVDSITDKMKTSVTQKMNVNKKELKKRRELTPEEETAIAKKARELVVKALVRVCAER